MITQILFQKKKEKEKKNQENKFQDHMFHKKIAVEPLAPKTVISLKINRFATAPIGRTCTHSKENSPL